MAPSNRTIGHDLQHTPPAKSLKRFGRRIRLAFLSCIEGMPDPEADRPGNDRTSLRDEPTQRTGFNCSLSTIPIYVFAYVYVAAVNEASKRRYYGKSRCETISVKLPAELLAQEAKARRIPKSVVVHEPGSRPRSRLRRNSCFDLARDLASSIKRLPRDLAQNPK